MKIMTEEQKKFLEVAFSKEFAEKLSQAYVDCYKRDKERWYNYIMYEVYTPWYIKLWHKLIKKETPKY